MTEMSDATVTKVRFDRERFLEEHPSHSACQIFWDSA